MSKNLIKKEYVIQAFDKDNNVWRDYARYDTRYHKKASLLKTIEGLNAYKDGKYRLIVCKSFLELDVKDEAVQTTPKTITFGKWKKPLTWTVIDEDDKKILLLCDTCVEFMRFDGNNNNYMTSEIRSWLNNNNSISNKSQNDYTNIGFLNAFTENEKRMFDSYGCEYVGLLSESEYRKYKEKIPNVDSKWWIRSPGNNALRATCVYCDGFVNSCGDCVRDGYVGVRPALWLKKEN
jgi:hypothetical protein